MFYKCPILASRYKSHKMKKIVKCINIKLILTFHIFYTLSNKSCLILSKLILKF